MLHVADHVVKPMLESSKRVSLTKILVTTDFSEVSDRALDYTIALARRSSLPNPSWPRLRLKRCGRRPKKASLTF